jgi:transcription initiation factor TFIIB
MSPNDDVWSIFDTFNAACEGPEPEVIESKDACEHCDNSNVVLDDGNYVCLSCHNVANRLIDMGAEWRFFRNDDKVGRDPSRCGMPIDELLPDMSLGTMIASGPGESYKMRMVRKYQCWNSMKYKERSLYNIFSTLSLNAANNGIPAIIVDDAKNLYKQMSEMKLSRGENKNGLIASSIYMACKRNNVPRSAKEIAKIFNLSVSTMTRGCKRFQDTIQITTHTTTPRDFICRFVSNLNLPSDIRTLCIHVVQKAEDMLLNSDNTPPSFAAGCIYLTCTLCKVNIDKKNIASECDVSMVTVTKCSKKLHVYRMHLFPESAIKTYDVV